MFNTLNGLGGAMRTATGGVILCLLFGLGASGQDQTQRKWLRTADKAGAAGIERVLSQLSVGPAERCGRLTLYPVVNTGDECRMTVVTVEQALRNRWVEVVEEARGRKIKFRDYRSPAIMFMDMGTVMDGGGQDSTGGAGGGNPPSGGPPPMGGGGGNPNGGDEDGNGNGSGGGNPNGNNGVGNGEDPAPPGNPPGNDGEGTGPGNPGNGNGNGNDGNNGNNGNGNNGNGNGNMGVLWRSEYAMMDGAPTFCCERNRGEDKADKRFARAEFVAPPVTRSAIARSNQEAVWESIASLEKATGASSSTNSLDSLYRSAKVAGALNAAVLMLKAAAVAKDPASGRSAIGCIFALDGRLVAIDLYASPAHYRAAFTALVKSYALEALGTPPAKGATPTQQQAVELLREVLKAKPARGITPIGCGTTYPVQTRHLRGCIWTVGGTLLRADLLVKSEEPQKPQDTPTPGTKK